MAHNDDVVEVVAQNQGNDQYDETVSLGQDGDEASPWVRDEAFPFSCGEMDRLDDEVFPVA